MVREEIIASIFSRKKYLEQIIDRCRSELKSAPAGSLIASCSHGVAQYYVYADGRRAYTKDALLAERLAYKCYYSALMKRAESELSRLTSFLEKCRDASVEDVYRDLPELKKPLIKPLCVDNDTYAEWWMSQQYKSLNYETSEEYSTNGSDRYRSKSESMIAACLREAGIPFRYECQLHLKGFGDIYPDFTVLNRRTREVFYHEHFGMMENADYAAKALQKINAYEKNGLLQGRKLITTFESEHVHIDMRVVQKIIEEFYL